MNANAGGPSGTDKVVRLETGPGEADEVFKRRVDSLSRQLADRFAEGAPSPGEPSPSVESGSRQPTGAPDKNREVDLAVHVAHLEEQLSRRPWFKFPLAFALGVAASLVAFYAFQEMRPPPAPPPTAMAATPSPVPGPTPAPPPPPVVVYPTPPPIQPLPAAPAPAAPNAPAIPKADPNKLSIAEIRELQTRLESLGMDPGAVDGVFGRRTAEAVRRYEESKGQPQIGNPARELLNQLRQEQN